MHILICKNSALISSKYNNHTDDDEDNPFVFKSA